MKIINHCTILLVIFITAVTGIVRGQSESLSKVEFLNAPVVLKNDPVSLFIFN